MEPLNLVDFGSLRHLRLAPIFVYGTEMDICGATPSELATSPESQPFPIIYYQKYQSVLRDALPENLETLDILFCDEEADGLRLPISLKGLLANRDVQFPRLREVSVHTTNPSWFERVLDVYVCLPWEEKDVRLLVKYEVGKGCDNGQRIDKGWGWDEDIV